MCKDGSRHMAFQQIQLYWDAVFFFNARKIYSSHPSMEKLKEPYVKASYCLLDYTPTFHCNDLIVWPSAVMFCHLHKY